MSDCGVEITKYYIVEPSPVISGETIQGDLTVYGYIFNCSGTTFTDFIDPCSTGVTISNNFTVTPNEVIPTSDDTKTLGTLGRRWRSVNTVSGTSTTWSSSSRVITPRLELGVDISGNTRTITANNSIIQNDCLNGGTY
jgi:hypothetical protein